MRILLVEDDRELAQFVKQGLEDEGYSVAVQYNGSSGLRAAEISAFDLIVLDVMLPTIDGFEVTRRLRLQCITTPILLLTGRDAPQDVVKGLDAGADDYLTKPFSFEVLVARIRARTRVNIEKGSTMRYADLVLDDARHEVTRGGTPVSLTRTEFSLLECLMKSAGRIVTRDRLIDVVWGDREISDNNIEVFVRLLRSKIDSVGRKKLIHTERGIGYVLKESGE